MLFMIKVLWAVVCISTHLLNKPECQQKGFYLKHFLHSWPLHREPVSRRFIKGFYVGLYLVKEEQESSRRQHKNLQQGKQEQQQKSGEDTGWGRGWGQPGGSLVSWMALHVRFFPHDLIMDGILNGLECQVFSSWPRHGWDLQQWLPAGIHKKISCRDFPGSPVVKTPCFHCMGHKFDPSSGN